MSLPLIIYAPWNEMAQDLSKSLLPPSAEHWMGTDRYAQIMYSFFVPANSRAFFTANDGFLILLLFSLPVGRRGGGWWRISESPLSGISATARRRNRAKP